MKIRISRDIRKYLILYLALLVMLYLVIEMVPKLTDVFETTQILEPGSLQLTNEADGYLIKTEVISTSPKDGVVDYLVKEGQAVRKNQAVATIKGTPAEENTSMKYEDLMERLKGYEGVYEGGNAPISGVFALTMDGSEGVLNPEHMDSLTYKQVKDLPLHQKSLRNGTAKVGDPIFKITNDNKWYVVSWLKKDKAENYSEGQEVQLELPAGTAAARIWSIKKEDKRYKVIFFSDVYYKDLATERKVEMTIRSSNRSGLLIENECIIEKKGQKGVYVRDKNGEYHFVRVNVIESDGSESVISESSFIDPETSEAVSTASVYDEVLKQPEKMLKRELRQEEKEKKKKEREKEKQKQNTGG